MSNFKYKFGLEIHARLLTKTKAFSPAKVDLNSKPNTNIHPFDLGYPGQKPSVNKKVIEFAYRLAKVLEMNISDTISFDRKNYFYPDLAPGYQITQFYNPIAKGGFFEIDINETETKKIKITQIQIEQDTAKQFNKNGKSLFDFNRAGVPLLEIITDFTDLESIEEVVLFLKQLKEQLIVLNINDGTMHNGSFRVDVNVSVSNDGSTGQRVEIKNLNSFNNIEKALKEEIELQKNSILNNEKIPFVTKKYDEDSETLITMREKNSIDEYSFLPEGNIIPIAMDNGLKAMFENSFNIQKLKDIKNELKNISNNKQKILLSNINAFRLFEKLKSEIEYESLINFIISQWFNVFKKETDILDFNEKLLLTYKKIINLLREGKITNTDTNSLLIKIHNNVDIEKELINLENEKLLSVEEVKEKISLMVEEYIKNTKESDLNLENYKRKIMGQLMKESKGSINPKNAMELIEEVISEKI